MPATVALIRREAGTLSFVLAVLLGVLAF